MQTFVARSASFPQPLKPRCKVSINGAGNPVSLTKHGFFSTLFSPGGGASRPEDVDDQANPAAQILNLGTKRSTVLSRSREISDWRLIPGERFQFVPERCSKFMFREGNFGGTGDGAKLTFLVQEHLPVIPIDAG
jgi:hypothetical protein